MGLAIWISKLQTDRWTLLVDGDMHVRSIQLKMCPVSDVTFADVLSGKPLEEAVYLCELQSRGKPLFPNLAILPAGGRFLPPMRGDPIRFVDQTRQKFDEIIQKLRKRFGYILVDTPASMSFEHLILTAIADAVIYVAEANDDSVEATVLTAKGLKRFMDVRALGSILNKLPSHVEEEEWVRKLSRVAPVLGIVPDDDLVDDAFRRNIPVAAAYPNSPASRALEEIAHKILMRKLKPARVPERIDRAIKVTAQRVSK